MARMGSIDTQYFDLENKPLGLGKLYFYEAGTTTPKATYSDDAYSIANDNPLVLDQYGIPGDIWFEGLAKVVLTDSDDVVLRTTDPVDGDVSATPGGGEMYWDFVSAEQTSDFTAVAGKFYFIDATGGNIAVTMPAAPTTGNRVGFALSQDPGSYHATVGTHELDGSFKFGASFIYLGSAWVLYQDEYFYTP